MTTPTRRTLAEHVQDAVAASIARIVERSGLPSGSDEAEALRERVEARYTAAEREGRVSVTLAADRSRRGRVDSRSLEAVVTIDVGPGPVELCRVRARDLVDADGLRVDARQTTRELLHQHAEQWPDTVPDEWPARPPHPALDREARDRLLEQREAEGWPEQRGRDSDADRLNGDDRG